MLSYSDVESFVSAGLTTLQYGQAGKPAMPVFNPGPPAIQTLWKKSPHGIVFLTVGNGIGPTVEALYDQPFIVVRILGRQNDYAYAETLSHDIDALMMAVGETAPQMVGNTRTLYIRRNAPPQLVDFDSADRYHFQTTYIAEARR